MTISIRHRPPLLEWRGRPLLRLQGHACKVPDPLRGNWTCSTCNRTYRGWESLREDHGA
jgi:hypothetical protein